MREIRPRGTWAVAKVPDKILGVGGTLISNELESFMFVGLHFGTTLGFKISGVSDSEGI
jgi:hypothetical protein